MLLINRLMRRRKEGGAALVEFAILAPLLLTLLFGIVEFGWVFSQHLDVRHGAREGARLAAVNYPVGPTAKPTPAPTPANRAALIAEACNRMTNKTGTFVTISAVAGTLPTTTTTAVVPTTTIPAGAAGSKAVVTMWRNATTLTGFLNWALPSTLKLQSTVEIRLEQPRTWTDGTDIPC